MAKKTYRTYNLKGLRLLLKDEAGERVEIRFFGGIQIDSTAKFTTKDEKIQRLLENCSGFGRDYYIESVVEDKTEAPVVEKEEVKPEPKKEIMTEVKGSERFKNLVEMKNRMAELGIKLGEGANYQKAKAAAIAAGYDFQIKK